MMMRTVSAALLIGALGFAAPAAADPPPADARPLSEILRIMEERENVAWFEEIEWDDDGYWEIEFHRVGGESAEVRVDPRTGEIRD